MKRACSALSVDVFLAVGAEKQYVSSALSVQLVLSVQSPCRRVSPHPPPPPAVNHPPQSHLQQPTQSPCAGFHAQRFVSFLLRGDLMYPARVGVSM